VREGGGRRPLLFTEEGHGNERKKKKNVALWDVGSRGTPRGGDQERSRLALIRGKQGEDSNCQARHLHVGRRDGSTRREGGLHGCYFFKSLKESGPRGKEKSGKECLLKGWGGRRFGEEN